MILGEIYSVEFCWHKHKKVPLISAVIICPAITGRCSGLLMLKGIILAVRVLNYLRANC